MIMTNKSKNKNKGIKKLIYLVHSIVILLLKYNIISIIVEKISQKIMYTNFSIQSPHNHIHFDNKVRVCINIIGLLLIILILIK